MVANKLLDADGLVEVFNPHLLGQHIGIVLVEEHQSEIGMTQFLVLVVFPELVVTMMDFVPGVELTIADVGTQLVDIFFGHRLTAQVNPLADAFALHPFHDMLHIDALILWVFNIVQTSLHGVIGNHVAVGLVSLHDFVDDYFAVTLLDLLAQHFQLVDGIRLVVQEVLAAFAQVVVLVLRGVFALRA